MLKPYSRKGVFHRTVTKLEVFSFDWKQSEPANIPEIKLTDSSPLIHRYSTVTHPLLPTSAGMCMSPVSYPSGSFFHAGSGFGVAEITHEHTSLIVIPLNSIFGTNCEKRWSDRIFGFADLV